MTVAEYVERVSHREHREWCFYKEILKAPKKQATLPDGTPYGPRPVTKEDKARIAKINWQRQAGAAGAKDPRAEAMVRSAAEHRRKVKNG